MFKAYVALIIPFILSYTAYAGEMYTNRLINEKSPYLLQHAHNPVNWFPWGNEAFRKAEKEDKPVFLSIGYSTCHWCHVMEEESFSDPRIARLLNKYFISVKVDREERPDIDNTYMKAVAAMTGGGGWPLTVFLTPGKKAFYGGTYFPPYDRHGMPGLERLLIFISKSWENKREEILKSGDAVTKAVYGNRINTVKTGGLKDDILKDAYKSLLSSFDEKYGGFGSSPKFPVPHYISFLLRYWKRTGDAHAVEVAEKTLLSMSRGGIYDHIGGGFYRYSTDRKWFLPHFEKMIYTQALMAKAYLEAYQVSGRAEYADTARGILDYALRCMQDASGGFYTAEDADSPLPGNPSKKGEGAFYLWMKKDIIDILGKKEGERFSGYFGIKEGGNIHKAPEKAMKGQNILYINGDNAGGMGRLIKIVFDARKKRHRPFLDKKILTDKNGLMISALCAGGRILRNKRYIDSAERAAHFLLDNMVLPQGGLFHRYISGEPAVCGVIDDYAFFVQGLIDLYEATFNTEYLKSADRIMKYMIKHFWDTERGGFFFTEEGGGGILGRQKEAYDGSIPSGNSIAALCLLRLGLINVNEGYKKKAEDIFKVFSGDIYANPAGYIQMLNAFSFALGPPVEILISGRMDDPETKRMINAVYSGFMPYKVVMFMPKDGKSVARVCTNYTCREPVYNVNELKKNLFGE